MLPLTANGVGKMYAVSFFWDMQVGFVSRTVSYAALFETMEDADVEHEVLYKTLGVPVQMVVTS